MPLYINSSEVKSRRVGEVRSLTIAAHATVERVGRAAGLGVVMANVANCGRQSIASWTWSWRKTDSQHESVCWSTPRVKIESLPRALHKALFSKQELQPDLDCRLHSSGNIWSLLLQLIVVAVFNLMFWIVTPEMSNMWSKLANSLWVVTLKIYKLSPSFLKQWSGGFIPEKYKIWRTSKFSPGNCHTYPALCQRSWASSSRPPPWTTNLPHRVSPCSGINREAFVQLLHSDSKPLWLSQSAPLSSLNNIWLLRDAETLSSFERRGKFLA